MQGSATLPAISPEEQSKKQYAWENVPEEKRAEIIAYTKQLRKKFPKMKPARLQRKVAEYFKIKLV